MGSGVAMRLLAEDGYDPDLLSEALVSNMPQGSAQVQNPAPKKPFAAGLRNARILVEATDYSERNISPEVMVCRTLLNVVLRHASEDFACNQALSIMSKDCISEEKGAPFPANERLNSLKKDIDDILYEDLDEIAAHEYRDAMEEMRSRAFKKDEISRTHPQRQGTETPEKDPDLGDLPVNRPRKASGSSQSQLAKDSVEVEAAVNRAFRNLSEEASAGKIDPVIGRDPEIERVMSAIQRRRKRSVILHGPAGVGKTSIAEGIALALRAVDAPAHLADRKIYELSMSALIAGARYRGDFEERMEKALARITEENAIIFIDEIHTLMGLGSSQHRGMDAPNILKPALARGDLVIIGATTTEELPAIYQDRAILRRFELIEVLEPDHDMMEEILDRAGMRYLDHHGVDASRDMLREIIRICGAYMTDSCFPDKAFDILDRACVEALRDRSEKISLEHVQRAAQHAGALIPMRQSRSVISASRKAITRLRSCTSLPEDISHLEESLSVKLLAPALRPGVPGWFLTGSRDACKRATSDILSALRKRETVFPAARLADQSAGDWLSGSSMMRSNGALCEALETSPDNILLFEDIDEASASALSVIRQLLERGDIRSGTGRLIPARRCIAIFTSRNPEGAAIGFGSRDACGAGPVVESLLEIPGTLRVNLASVEEKLEAEDLSGEIVSFLKATGLQSLLSDKSIAELGRNFQNDPMRISAMRADMLGLSKDSPKET